MKIPELDLSGCSMCEMCFELCPDVFKLNDAGYIEVIELENYPIQAVDEIIKNCPADCIYWVS